MHTRSEPAQLLEVNLSVLDSLVLDYLAKEELIEDASGAVEGLLQRRAAATAAYQQLQQGHLSSVLAIVEQFCPAVLQDQRLAFKLKRQQFIELLRQGSTAGDAAALACARDELAPLALDAYPEAYLDFKKALLLLLHVQSGSSSGSTQQQQQQQQQKQELSLQARQELAEVLHHTMLQQLGCTAPTLSLVVSYLLLLWDQHTGPGGGGSSSRAGRGTAAAVQQLLAAGGAELAAGLLLQGRDAAPLPPDVSGQGHPERDVQALMAAVGIPRQAAVDGLKAAGGEAALALGRQLQRLRLNKPQLDALLWEYACDRGLVEPTESPAAAAAAALAAAALLADSSAPAAAAAMDIDTDHTSAAAAAPAAVAAVAGSSSGKPLVTSAKRSSPAAAAEGGPGAAAGGGSTAAAQAADAAAAGAVTPGDAVAAALGSPSAAGGGAAGAAAAGVGEPVWPAAMLRSESQSPPYKVPRWRSKQTPSRFCGLAPAQQQQQQSKSAAAAADAPQPQPGQQQQHQDQQQQALAQQLVHWARQEQQQRRWQQLQHALKSRAAAAGGGGSNSSGSSSSGGGGSSRAARAAEVSAGLQQLGRLVKGGAFAGVEVCLEELAPGLLGELPGVKFDVKRCQFMQLVERGQPSEALLLARSQLTPLADKHPELLPTLKASMALLLPGPLRAPPAAAAAANGAPGSAAAASSSSASSSAELGSALLAQLLPLLQDRLGLEPSPLVTLLRLLLTSHKGWFRLQRCQDPFSSALWIDRLLAVQAAAGAGLTAPPGAAPQQQGGAAGVGAGAAQEAAAAAAGGGPGFVDAAGADEDELMMEDDDLGEGEFDESAVLQVMEVLELPRAAALELLADHGGDAQAAIMAVFGA